MKYFDLQIWYAKNIGDRTLSKYNILIEHIADIHAKDNKYNTLLMITNTFNNDIKNFTRCS